MRTREVELEPLSVAHAEELFGALQAPDIYTFIPEDPPATLADLRRRHERLIAGPGPSSPERWFNGVMRETRRNRAIGLLQATVQVSDRTASVAYVLLPEHQGKGLARQGVERMMDELAATARVETFVAEIDSRNERSLALAKRLGFERVGREATDVGEDHVYARRRG